jgi:hypothetical protein
MDFVRASWGTAMLCPYRDEARVESSSGILEC